MTVEQNNGDTKSTIRIFRGAAAGREAIHEEMLDVA